MAEDRLVVLTDLGRLAARERHGDSDDCEHGGHPNRSM
jgi:hypothetical protein